MKPPVFRSRNIERSKELRRSASPAERKLWSCLKSGQITGHRFTRQFQIGPYFTDLVCRSKRLVVEVDGFSHDMQQAYDERRTEFLMLQGYRIVRFTNEDIETNVEGVVTMITQALADAPSPSPSRKREGNT